MTRRRSSRFADVFYFAILLGLATAAVDMVLVIFNVGGVRGSIWYLPLMFWGIVPLTWAVVCGLAGILPPLFRLPAPFSASSVVVAGPCLLVLSRAVPALVHIFPFWLLLILWSIISATAVWTAFRYGVPQTSTAVHRALDVALIGIVVFLFTIPVIQRQKPALIDSKASERPNVVLIFLDTLRYDESLRLRNLESLGSESAVFTNAWAPAPWTIPSHFAMLTGKDPWRLGDRDWRQNMPLSVPTLAQRLSRQGYSTAAVFANPSLNRDTGIARGFDTFVNFDSTMAVCRSGIGFLVSRAILPRDHMPFCSWRPATAVTHATEDVLDAAHPPFFVAINYIDAHDPYYVPRGCAGGGEMLSLTDHQLLRRVNDESMELSSSDVQRIRNLYDRASQCMDRSVGELLTYLRRRSDFDHTIVVIVGDHGEQFGEHRLAGHGNSVYRQVLHVPLMVRIPGKSPAIIDDPVSTSDLYLTLLQLTGVKSGTPVLFEAESRRPAISLYLPPLSASGRFADAVFSVAGRDIHLLRSQNGEETMFNYRVDPAEIIPLKSIPVGALETVLSREWILPKHRDANFYSLGYLQ